MERLTELKYDITKLDSRIKNMHEYIEKTAFDDKAEVEFLASTVSYLKELREYKQLEEQDLLLRLPCKIGATVYLIKSDGKIVPRTADMMFLGVLWEDYGKEWFLTQSEAEQRLKEMENESSFN